MERIIELFCELQRELFTFVEKSNRQISTPRCDFGCTHCIRLSTAKEKLKRHYEVVSYKDNDGDCTPEDDERFEQSELQISEVIENYANGRESDERNVGNECVNGANTLMELPEEMTVSEGSFSSHEDGERDDELGDENETENDDEDEEETHCDDETRGDAEKENCHVDVSYTFEGLMTQSLVEGGDESLAVDNRTCKYCDRVFSFPYLVKRHETVHTGPSPYRCIGCRDTFADRASLHAHKTCCQAATLTCLDCGTRFANAKKLKQHTASAHSAEKCAGRLKLNKARPFRCHVCTRQFTNNSALSKHLTVHSDAKRFHCSECGKEYSYMERLRNHMKIFHPHSTNAE